jgi:SMI1-KNR4 cell-wall
MSGFPIGGDFCRPIGYPLHRQKMLSADFLTEFKRATEAKWREKSIDPTLYGFQFQRGTRWNQGLSDEMVTEYERDLGVRLPHDFKEFLREMNGTDLATLNVYGSCGESPRESVGVYSYPKDIETVKARMEHIRGSRADIASDLAGQGFELPTDATLVPIFIHRYVLCTSDPSSSVVLSIVVNATDAIVYGNSLREYLEKEFLTD